MLNYEKCTVSTEIPDWFNLDGLVSTSLQMGSDGMDFYVISSQPVSFTGPQGALEN